MTKAVQSSGASLSAAAFGAASARALTARPGTPSRLCARTIVETAACPPELKRGEQPWAFSDFKVQKMLGEGQMSSVVHCVCGRSGVHAAIKMYHRDRMNAMNVKQVSREIEIHASLLHHNVVRLFAAFEDADGIYLVQEYASRGDLYVELSRRGGYMAEAHVVKNVLIPFLSALTYMHAQGVLHRDIKPENIMLSGEGEVKVGDFGLAINTTREKPVSRVGTLDYMPPEIVKLPHGGSNLSAASKVGCEDGAAYGLPADAWCVGVLAYELLVGSPPFEAESKDATYTRILKLEPSIPSHISDQAKGFIKQALKKDPSQHPTVHQMLRHPWLRTYQRPKSMAVLETPSKSQLSVSFTQGTAGSQADGGIQQLAVAYSEEQGEAPQASAFSTTAPPLPSAAPDVTSAPTAESPGRAAGLGKSLSFSSAMAGRFSAVKPTKPSPFGLLMRPKGSASSRAEAAASREATAAEAVAEVEAEQASKMTGEGAQAVTAAVATSSKAAPEERLVIHVHAMSGSAAMATSASPAAIPASADQPSQATTDLIPAALHKGSRLSAVGMVTVSAGASSDAALGTPRSGGGSNSNPATARGSFAAAIKRKLSNIGSGMFATASAAEEAVAAEAAAAGVQAGASNGIDTIAAVQAPSMQQLLTLPRAGAGPAGPNGPRRSSSGKRLLQAIGRKWSLGGKKEAAAV